MCEEIKVGYNKNNSCRFVLGFDDTGFFVECCDTFSGDFCWKLSYENFSDAVSSFESECNR